MNKATRYTKSGCRHIVDSLDLSPAEYADLFSLATKIRAAPSEYASICHGRLMATLFYEPSTRTRLSFEAAMLRLGGRVLTVADPATSAVAKGETLADTIRTVGSYADIVVLRHPKEGAARLAALYAPVPLINGGDGAREHPTQTLTDMFTIQHFKGRLSDLTVAFCGDLRYGRTVHSLIRALTRCRGMRFILISPQELRLPAQIKEEIKAADPQARIEEVTAIEDGLPAADVLYMTRIQKERFFNEEDYIKLRDTYILTPERLASAKQDAIVMHPLPRVTEIAAAVDSDERAVYFQQARLGMLVRMALIARLLEVI
ncbi:aspartate carbamoyltransferase [Candidatus Bipolaricaulota bacterium]|nr:aspartate carbamoyltransferase [Candidatus Bipolaricaulota bacterium]